jgi:hypothetical protein
MKISNIVAVAKADKEYELRDCIDVIQLEKDPRNPIIEERSVSSGMKWIAGDGEGYQQREGFFFSVRTLHAKPGEAALTMAIPSALFEGAITCEYPVPIEQLEVFHAGLTAVIAKYKESMAKGTD